VNADTRRTLDVEGVKEMQVRAAAYAVGGDDDDANLDRSWVSSGFGSLVNRVREVFAKEAKDDAEREAIAEHWADVSVSAVIRVQGGSRGEPIIVRSLEDIAKETFADMPDGAEIVLITKKGNPISPGVLTLGTSISIKRIGGQNDLDPSDAWDKLAAYREELRHTGRWQR
jgi:hypothetical protein